MNQAGIEKAVKNTWIVTYQFGTVKAGPVIRFLRYVPLFKQNGIKTTFVTKNRNEKADLNGKEEYDTVFFDCVDMVQLTKKAIVRAIKEKNRPESLVFFSLEHNAFFHFLAARLCGIKLLYVSTMQFDIKVKEFGKNRNLLSQILLKFILNRLFSLMNAIICSTNLLQEDFIKLGVPKNKVKVIYNGVNTDRFKPVNQSAKIELRNKLGLAPGAFIFLYVGLFVERKGVDYLMTLWENFIARNPLQPCKLLMVGDEMLDINENSAEFKQKWPKIKDESIKTGTVVFQPFSDSIQDYYQASDAFIFMSRLEGMPNVLLESMSSGLPVLVNKFKGFSSDYGTEGKEFMAMTNDLEIDLNILQTIVNTTSKREQLSQSARIHAAEKFDFNKSISAFCDLIA